MIAGQHGVAVCDEICKHVTARMGEVEDSMTNFDVLMNKDDTSLEITQKLVGQHNRAQHSGRESSVPQTLNNFLQLAAEDTQCKKKIFTLMCEAIVETGMSAKSGNTETIVKQMRPAGPSALDVWYPLHGRTWQGGVAQAGHCPLYNGMLCWNATRKLVARMQLHGLAEE